MSLLTTDTKNTILDHIKVNIIFITGKSLLRSMAIFVQYLAAVKYQMIDH